MSNELVVSQNTPLPGDEGYGVGAGSSTPSTSLTRAQIEHIRATDFDRYVGQGLHKQLLRMTADEMGTVAPTVPLSADESRRQLQTSEAGRYLTRYWDKLGSFQMQLGRTQASIGALVRSLGDDRHQRAFMARFDKALPEPVRLAIFDTLTTIGENGFVTPVSADDVKFFSKDSAGAQLVREWGSDAPTRIARIWKKFGYLESLVTLDHIRAWFDQLPDREARAVLEFASR